MGNNIDKQYQKLLQDILDNGVEKKDRTGTGTLSVFGRQIRHRMSEGFPLLTTKRMAWKSICTELLWFLRGDTSIEYLLENDCNIWTGDAYKNYCMSYKDGHEFYEDEEVKRSFTQEEFINKIKTDNEFAKKWGSLGRIYGAQWRDWLNLKWEATDKTDPSHPNQPMMKWNIESIDQIANLISELKTNPDSRRLLVSAWNVGELDQMVLPPCHYGFQVYTRVLSDEEQRARCHPSTPNAWDDLKEFAKLTGNSIEDAAKAANIPTRAISLMYNARSQDVPLGTPFNIASYALLLEIIAKMVNMVPDELITNMGDCHIYLNQIDSVKEQLTREPYELPTVKISDRVVNDISEYRLDDFILENYKSHPKIYFPLSN